MTDSELEELRKGLEGVTPGPWIATIDKCARCEAEGKLEGDIYDVPSGFHARFGNFADAAHIARCHPEAIRSLLSRLEAAEGGWLPIESAPHGAEVLALVLNSLGVASYFTAIRRTNDQWVITNSGWDHVKQGYATCVPTHWRPLPPPPSEA